MAAAREANPFDFDEAQAVLRTQLSRKLFASEHEQHLDDLVQDGLVQLIRWTRREQVNDLARMASTVATRVYVDFVRSKKSRTALEHAVESEHVAFIDPRDPADDLEAHHLDRIRFLILELFRNNKPECEALARAYFKDLNWKHVAADLDLGHDVVRARWTRCKRRLRELARELPELARLREWAHG